MKRLFSLGGDTPAPHAHSFRIDPAALPVRYRDRTDGVACVIELDRSHVIVARTIDGVRTQSVDPLSSYTGVAVRLVGGEEEDGVALILTHADAALNLTLFAAPNADDIVAEWRLWARALALPMLITEANGSTRPAFPMVGRLMVGETALRRSRGFLKGRRPSVYKRRSLGRSIAGIAVYRGEREIIARD